MIDPNERRLEVNFHLICCGMDNDAGLSASAVRDASLNEVLPLIKVSGDP